MNKIDQPKRVSTMSIATLVVIALVGVTTLVLAAFAVVNYRSEETERWQELHDAAKANADQLAAALALPVWNFDRPQIDRVIESIMREPVVAVVEVHLQSTPDSRVTWIRGESGSPRKADPPATTNGLLKESRTVKASDGSVLGTVQLFFTPKLLQAELRSTLIVTIWRIVAVDAVLTCALYLVFWRWVLKPLKVMEAFALGKVPTAKLSDQRFHGELRSVRTTVQNTLHELRRQAAFDESMTRLMAGFVSATVAEIDVQLNESLKEIAEFVGVESAMIVQVLREGEAWGCTHEWSSPKVGNRAERFKYMPMGSSEYFEQRIFANEPVMIASINQIPIEAKEIRERWAREGFKALLSVPLRSRGGQITGALTLLSFAREVEWQRSDTARLQIMSEAIANTLQRKRAEESLLQSRGQLRALTGRLQSLREEERTRISREIHDHLGQLLTALKLDLRLIERKVAALEELEAKVVLTGKLSSAQKLADETLLSVQKIASELRPGILDRLGLAAAIQSETTAFETRTSIRCDCHIVDEPFPEIPQEYATAAFRIFQELLTNIARHAKASEARVRLGCHGGRLILEVRDNGLGIMGSDIDNPKSLGILGMQERAVLLGGSVGIKGERGKGTTVVVTIPLGSLA